MDKMVCVHFAPFSSVTNGVSSIEHSCFRGSARTRPRSHLKHTRIRDCTKKECDNSRVTSFFPTISQVKDVIKIARKQKRK
ncbi:hypothetical protein, partial [Enterococcus lactis]|uniref:hypothetical protein n=2 Tax=Enterococcus lactis TaxID=357441 RepID=UPI0022E7CDB9